MGKKRSVADGPKYERIAPARDSIDTCAIRSLEPKDAGRRLGAIAVQNAPSPFNTAGTVLTNSLRSSQRLCD